MGLSKCSLFRDGIAIRFFWDKKLLPSTIES
jgi:hypothetical protein